MAAMTIRVYQLTVILLLAVIVLLVNRPDVYFPLTPSTVHRLWSANNSMDAHTIHIGNVVPVVHNWSSKTLSNSKLLKTADFHIDRPDLPGKPQLSMALALWGLPLAGRAPDYLASYKNPCWYNTSSHSRNETPLCLPYFYELGVGKSGTSTLYENILKHPDVCRPSRKELWFWSNPDIRKDLMRYISRFGNATSQIHSQQNTSGYHQRITFEATPAYFTNQGDLSKIPGNWNHSTKEPNYTLAHTLYALNPNTRLLVALRHPTNRLFSHYHHFHKNGFSGKDFHEHVVAAVAMMRACLAKRSLRSCVFDYWLNQRIRQGGRIMLHYSMYYPYAVEWLSVFPRYQMMFVISEDWYFNSSRVITEIFDFLGLRRPDEDVYGAIETGMEMYRHSPNKKFNGSNTDTFHNEMWPETRAILDNFFRPFNVKLAAFLGDNRFLFDKR